MLSSLDSAWLLRQWAMARVNPLETLAERENIYKLLSQTSDGAAGGLKDNHKVGFGGFFSPFSSNFIVAREIFFSKLHLVDSCFGAKFVR